MTYSSAPSSLLHTVTLVALALHIGAGALALVSGTVAAFARKGGGLHRNAGKVFLGSMLVMATLAIYLAFVMPDQTVNAFIGTLVIYLLATAWMTVRRRASTTGLGDKIALLVALGLWAPFAMLSLQLATGVTPLFKSAIPFEGSVLVAIYSFATLLTLAVIGDARVVLAGGISGARRIARHLWRMCFGLTLATGSAFSNGFARLLPGPYHVPIAFHVPKLLPLGLLIFWFIRVRFTDWRQRPVPDRQRGRTHARLAARYPPAMSELKLLQFPCRYPIKVMIRATVGLRGQLDAIVARHAGALAADDISERPSARENYLAVTYFITARDAAQIAALFAELKGTPGVLMVL